MEQKTAFLTLLGRPNVGKSSLMNRALGQKIAIVSDKPQTTRTRIMGVLTKDETQFVFIDTPGFHRPRNRLGENMMRAVGAGLSDVDGAVFVVDASRGLDGNEIPEAEQNMLERLKEHKLSTLLVLNKIDLLEDKEVLLTLISTYCKAHDFSAVIPLSAKTGDGVEILLDEMKRLAKPSPHYFDSEQITDQSEQSMVEEMIREKLLRRLDREVPHGIAVGLERFFERDNAAGEPILNVEAVIYCEKESHKGIIIGKGGNVLKQVGMDARRDIERFFGIKAVVKLWVKVKEDWRNREGLIRSFGLTSDN